MGDLSVESNRHLFTETIMTASLTEIETQLHSILQQMHKLRAQKFDLLLKSADCAPFKEGDEIRSDDPREAYPHGTVIAIEAEADEFTGKVEFTIEYRSINKSGKPARRIQRIRPEELRHWARVQ